MTKQPLASPRALNARAILAACGIEPELDFHALRSSQVARLLAEADRVRYRAPQGSSGSRARYFHAYVLRSMNAQGQATEPEGDS